MPYVVLAFRCALLMTFWVAAFQKFRHPASLAAFLTTASLVPRRMIRPITIAVPAGEAGIAIALCLPVSPMWAFGPSVVALATFTMITIAQPATRGCACFGRSSAEPPWWRLSRNLALLTMAGTGAAAGERMSVLTVPGATLAAVAGFALAAVIIFAADIAALFVPTNHEGVP